MTNSLGFLYSWGEASFFAVEPSTPRTNKKVKSRKFYGELTEYFSHSGNYYRSFEGQVSSGLWNGFNLTDSFSGLDGLETFFKDNPKMSFFFVINQSQMGLAFSQAPEIVVERLAAMGVRLYYLWDNPSGSWCYHFVKRGTDTVSLKYPEKSLKAGFKKVYRTGSVVFSGSDNSCGTRVCLLGSRVANKSEYLLQEVKGSKEIAPGVWVTQGAERITPRVNNLDPRIRELLTPLVDNKDGWCKNLAREYPNA